jgi:predicted transcriptional regulator of viral defense system
MKFLKTLGKISANLISALYDRNKTIFKINDAQLITGKNYNEVTDLLSELVRRKIIARLKAGKFLIIPQELGNIEQQYIGNWYIAAREVVNSPNYYVAFYSAMHYWGMLTQPLVKLFVAISQRQTIPLEMKDKLVFVFVNKKFVWGINDQWVTKTERVRMSDLEKTIVDALGFPRYCGGISEIAKGIWLVKDKINYTKLNKYISKYNKNIVAKRLGYILDVLKINQPDLKAELKKYIKNRYDLLDPTLAVKRISKNNWRLIDNVGQKQILNLIWH